MRLRSDIFVSALLRRAFAQGDFAAVIRKGHEEAGAIFIRQRFRDGLETLFAPAPQNFLDDDDGYGRLFEIRLAHVDASDIDAFLERERKFDSDLWIVEIESEAAQTLLPLVDPRA